MGLVQALVAVALCACTVARGGLAVDDAAVTDAGARDAGPPDRDASDDADLPEPDASLCPAGTADLNGDPLDGCECLVSPDVCNGRDDDCDPSTPDGMADPEVGVPCDGLDSDRCPEGTRICGGGAVICDDVSDDTPERCDTESDDDCDGETNEADAIDARTFYPDADGDGHALGGVGVGACVAPPGTSSQGPSRRL